MFFNKKMYEVFIGMDYTKFLNAQKYLRENGISYTCPIYDNATRLSANNLDGSLVSLSRDGTVKSYYKILVNKKDYTLATKILSQYHLCNEPIN